MAGHTKGPWIVKSGSIIPSDGTLRHVYPDGSRSSLAKVWPMNLPKGEYDANAQLMAAAPDLLEALKALWCDIVEYNIINHMPNANNNHAMLQAAAAMAKATGTAVGREE